MGSEMCIRDSTSSYTLWISRLFIDLCYPWTTGRQRLVQAVLYYTTQYLDMWRVNAAQPLAGGLLLSVVPPVVPLVVSAMVVNLRFLKI